ncbi:Protein Skeletor, isoforms D/E [Eufriesea mexicana]|nr:Protein Skeletor, isoforms D/E [Eufriesea mexicana]
MRLRPRFSNDIVPTRLDPSSSFPKRCLGTARKAYSITESARSSFHAYYPRGPRSPGFNADIPLPVFRIPVLNLVGREWTPAELIKNTDGRDRIHGSARMEIIRAKRRGTESSIDQPADRPARSMTRLGSKITRRDLIARAEQSIRAPMESEFPPSVTDEINKRRNTFDSLARTANAPGVLTSIVTFPDPLALVEWHETLQRAWTLSTLSRCINEPRSFRSWSDDRNGGVYNAAVNVAIQDLCPSMRQSRRMDDILSGRESGNEVCGAAYYGKLIGKLSELHHGVSGEVYAVDGRTLFVKDFTYDGEAPSAYFYVGNSKSPNANGIRVRDETGSSDMLKRYRRKDITLTLPEGKTLGNIKWFFVWCDDFSVSQKRIMLVTFGVVSIPLARYRNRYRFFAVQLSRSQFVTTRAFTANEWKAIATVNFGDVRIPRGFDYPKPQKLAALNGVHAVSSEPIVAVDAQTLLIPSFSYDGEAPDAKFWVGAGPTPSPQGVRVPDENGIVRPLRMYDRKTIVLTLPGDLTIHQIGHFGVWCEAFAVDFGHIQIPQGLNVPPSLKMLGVSPQNVHRGGQGQTLGLVNPYELSTSTSSSSSSQASPSPTLSSASALLTQQQYQRPTTYRPILRREDQVQVVQAIDYEIPKSLQTQEPLAQQLHRLQSASYPTPSGRSAAIAQYGDDVANLDDATYQQRFRSEDGGLPSSKLNCEVLEDRLAFEVRWAVAGDSIVAQLVGKLEDGQYMAFGISANPERSLMIGGDVAVAWVDKQTLQGYAVDYFLEAKSQCSGGRGSCPDTRIKENTNSIRLLNAALVDGYSIVTYQRSLKASDELDHQILTNGSQAIIWAIGPLNERQEVSFHTDYLKTDRFIDFGRPPVWNCPVPDHENSQILPSSNGDKDDGINEQSVVTPKRPPRIPATPAPAPRDDAWDIPPIQCDEPEDGVLYAQMGPTGGKHGYPAITGHVGWGISWYINGLLIPEINVVRGKKYTFVVEGGENPDTPARYHPFYITDDPIGGYQHKTPEEKACERKSDFLGKQKVKIFAGAQRQRGVYRPTGVGRLCNWVPDQNQPLADEFSSFGAYQRTLTLECDQGEPGFVEWTPDEDTPDTVYYQCYTHRYLGWKINVHDSCDTSEAAGSENHEFFVNPKNQRPIEDLQSSSSIRVSSKVTPTAEFLQQHPHHLHGEPGLRYSYHPATNPDKLSTSYTQLLTTANNNNYVRLKSSPYEYEEPFTSKPSYSTPGLGVAPHRHEVRVKETHHMHVDGDLMQQHHNHHHYHQQLAPIYREQSMGVTRLTSSYPGRQQIMEIQPELLRQPSNQQLSNLVADNPRPLSHGTKHAYPATASPQILYSRPVPHHYATNYHHLYHPPLPHHYHHHQPDQRTQLMFVKRPVLTRRPMLQTAHTMPQPTLPLPPRSVFMERKKTVYRPSSSTYGRRTADRLSQGNDNLQIAKLKKVDSKQRAKLETKVSNLDIPNIFVTPMKPARNTGFNPDSIVIESGFKPIIRSVEKSEDVAQRRISERIEEEEEPRVQETNRKPIDNFEPVFIPSPPVPTVATIKKSKKKTTNAKPRPSEADDMEMAADRVNAYYLPPHPSSLSNEPPPSPSPSAEVLITFDGKMLKDSSLVRSISGIEEHSKSKLSSDILSRTPQFGKFKGELPPPIPGEAIRSDHSQLEKRRLPSSDLSVPPVRTTKNTRLRLVERSKRSPHEGHVHVADFRANSSETNYHDNHDHRDHHGHRENSISTLVNAGQSIIANFGYILLAVIVYHVV